MDKDYAWIFIIGIIVYIIGISSCAYCLSDKNKKERWCDDCFKYIKKYNCFGDRVDEDPRIFYDEIV